MSSLSLSAPRFTLSRALIVTRREMRDQIRDWRIIVPVVTLTLFFPLLMDFTAKQAVGFVERYGAPIISERLIPFLLMVVGFFPISVSLVIALESFVGEKERHSLEPLLSTPLSNMQLYLGKTLAAMLPPLLASYLGIGVYLAGLYFTIGWTPTPILLAQIVTLTTVQAIVMVSAAVVISSQTTSVRAANLLASFVIIPMALLVQGEEERADLGIDPALRRARPGGRAFVDDALELPVGRDPEGCLPDAPREPARQVEALERDDAPLLRVQPVEG
ncbi:MAG: ABC transporter permease subunit, partial [Chloroflexi bacterium]|nr:ABC transporter permease subunit [Chloroflexota bacterium]